MGLVENFANGIIARFMKMYDSQKEQEKAPVAADRVATYGIVNS